jgi:soluble P-type ATPase
VKLQIPGFGILQIEHLVLDYNGTLAQDGRLLRGVRGRLARIARVLQIHVVTGDTFATARRALRGLPCRLVVLAARDQDGAKRRYVLRLGAGTTACIGNGRNDRSMLGAARLGIAVVQREGASTAALAAADLVLPSVQDALDLFLHPVRLTATLRS